MDTAIYERGCILPINGVFGMPTLKGYRITFYSKQ